LELGISYDDRFRREAIVPIQNKPEQFLLNTVMQNRPGAGRNSLNSRGDPGTVFVSKRSCGHQIPAMAFGIAC
jgi:hypothetical protein